MLKHLSIFALFLFAICAPSAAGEDKKAVSDISKRLAKAVKDGKDEDAVSVARELAAVGTPESLKALFDAGLKIEVPKIYKAVTGILAGLTDEASLKFFQDQAKAGKELSQVFLADILAEMKHAQATEILGILAEERNTVVLRSTISALARQKVKGSVEPLLKILERLETNKDHGQVYQELRDALFEVTSQDFDVLEDWKKWWDVAKGTFDPNKKPAGATQTRKPIRDSAPEFAGKKIFARNVVFVIDTSGSMQYVQKDDIPGLSRADGSDKAGGQQAAQEKITPENSRLAKFWTRIEMAKRALIKAVGAFDAKARINVIRFDTQVIPLEKAGLFPLGPAQKKKVNDWVKAMQIKGNTNTKEALVKAFELDRSTTEIYFLSDGIPSADGTKNDPTDPILEKVEALNRFRKVKIHTFGFDAISIQQGMEDPGLASANEFLKKLAKRTGGTFTLMKVTDEKPPKDYRSISGDGTSHGEEPAVRD